MEYTKTVNSFFVLLLMCQTTELQIPTCWGTPAPWCGNIIIWVRSTPAHQRSRWGVCSQFASWNWDWESTGWVSALFFSSRLLTSSLTDNTAQHFVWLLWLRQGHHILDGYPPRTFYFCSAKRLKARWQVPCFHGQKISITLKSKSNFKRPKWEGAYRQSLRCWSSPGWRRWRWQRCLQRGRDSLRSHSVCPCRWSLVGCLWREAGHSGDSDVSPVLLCRHRGPPSLGT